MANCQRVWDGGGGDDQWNNSLNWVGDQVPLAADEVILDNAELNRSYTVELPTGAVTTTVKTVWIKPGSGLAITLSLPATNTMVPGFVVTGPGYGLTIGKGGIFRNASGTQNGIPVTIADSIRINNGGLYIHNSAGGHAANVMVLSALPGTEEGVMEFDSPDASSTISLSGRTYGKLRLRSAAAGGTVNYTAAGTTRLLINSDLEIEAGVVCSLNFADTIFIRRDFLQQGGTFNLGASSREVTLSVQRNLVQEAGGLITETGTGNQVILLSGNQEQQISMKGSLLNHISWVMDGSGGGILLSPLDLPWRLELISGRLTTSSNALLTLLPGCSIRADSLSGSGFVYGPMKKEGLVGEYFLFPVGSINSTRWLALNKATGNFQVAYHRADPHSLNANKGAGIDHVSRLEYWSVEAFSPPSPGAAVKLSFDDPNSGGVTSLSDLRVARLRNGAWEGAGNNGVTGSPGSDGSVTSIGITGFPATEKYFTLASARAAENPLPLREITPRPSLRNRAPENDLRITLANTIVDDKASLLARSAHALNIDLVIYNSIGATIRKYHFPIPVGESILRLDIYQLPRGLYHVFGVTSASQPVIFRFFKR